MEVHQLGPGFFAEVRGAGLADVVNSDAAYAFVRAAFEEHSVLLFRKQPISDEMQVAFSRRFGPLLPATVGTLAEGSPFSILTNMDGKGGIVAPDSKETLRGLANLLWHTDASFKTTPALASVLSARTIASTGGETEFASTRCGWERLPEAMRERLEDACAWHDYGYSRGKAASASHVAFAREKDALPPVLWRMRWRNPVNGRDSLYIASHAYAIAGMTEEAAQALLDELTAFITAPGRTWLHYWQPGDVVMWDNRAILHRGRPWPDDQPRHMVRTTIAATAADGVEQIRPGSEAPRTHRVPTSGILGTAAGRGEV